MKGDWNGSGMHTNFSTNETKIRKGMAVIEEAVSRLAKHHDEHIRNYGAGLNEINRSSETCDINTLSMELQIEELRSEFLEVFS